MLFFTLLPIWTATTRGDLNGDGDVNISDAIMLINYLLNGVW